MSKKKHRDKRKEENFGGINPQILEMLKGSNLDFSKISSLLGAMNQDGFDINKLSAMMQGNQNRFDINSLGAMMQGGNNGLDLSNLGAMMQGNSNGFDISTLSAMLQGGQNSFDLNNIKNSLNNMDKKNYSFEDNNSYQSDIIIDDENIEMLLIVRSVVNPKKARFLDRVIEMYKEGKIRY